MNQNTKHGRLLQEIKLAYSCAMDLLRLSRLRLGRQKWRMYKANNQTQAEEQAKINIESRQPKTSIDDNNKTEILRAFRQKKLMFQTNDG